MANKIICKNCGKSIQEDFLSCPYCQTFLNTPTVTSNMKVDSNLTDDNLEEYYEEDDYEDDDYEDDEDEIEEILNSNLRLEEKEELEEPEKYYEEDDYQKEQEQKLEEIAKISFEPQSVSQPTPQPIPQPVPSFKPLAEPKNDYKEFTPINIDTETGNQTIAFAASAPATNLPYEANADHYYDDVLPEVIDDLRSNLLENILKGVGCIVLLLFVMWYLIYFL